MAREREDAAHDAVRGQFGRAAHAYAESDIHAKGDDLARLVAAAEGSLGSLEGRRVLDAATGAGHTAVAFARAGAVVAALDLTPEMLAVARTVASERLERGSIAFHEGSAEDLPFEADAFDALTCRIAAHHFADPQRFLREARRVLTGRGRLFLVDNIAPEDPGLGDTMNRIERMRDPSHVEAYTIQTWIDWAVSAELVPERLERWRRTKDFRDWARRGGMTAPAARELEAYLLDLPEEAQTYFRVQRDGDRVAALEHEVVLLVARTRP